MTVLGSIPHKPINRPPLITTAIPTTAAATRTTPADIPVVATLAVVVMEEATDMAKSGNTDTTRSTNGRVIPAKEARKPTPKDEAVRRAVKKLL